MKIVKVRGNVKAGCDVEIGQHTLIVGPNGSGKSSVVNTVELALTARAGDIAGRVDVGREADVMSLATDGAEKIQAEVVFDDGVAAVYMTSGSTAKAKKAQHIAPQAVLHPDVLPIRSLREAMLGSPATARKYLLSRMADTVRLEDVRQGFGPELQPMFDAVTGAVPPGTPTPDILVMALEKAASMEREATGRAKSAKQASAFVTGGAAIPPTQEEVAAAVAAAKALQDAYTKALTASAQAQNIGLLRYDLTKAEAEAVEAIGTFKAAEESFAQLTEPTPLTTDFDIAFKAAKASVQAGGCVVCGNEDIESIKESLDLGATAFELFTGAKLTYDAAKARVTATKKEADLAVKAYERMEQKLHEAEQEAGEGAATESHEAIAQQYEAANQRVMDLQQQRSAWDTARKAQAQADAAEVESDRWNALKINLSAVVSHLVDGALAAFTAKVQANLPPTDKFEMRLRDGDREVVQFGLVRNGHLHTALSGAEWARVMAALADACVPSDTYACIIPEERAFDAVTLSSVMRALSATPHQVILTSPIAPKSPPKGWTIIKRGEE